MSNFTISLLAIFHNKSATTSISARLWASSFAFICWLIPFSFIRGIFPKQASVNLNWIVPQSFETIHTNITQPNVSSFNFSIFQFFIFVCAVGLILFFFRLFKHLKWQQPFKHDKALKPFKYYKGIPVFASNKIGNALLLGYRKPSIWINSQLLQSPYLNMILEHEATHNYYKDNYWLVVIEMVRDLYWWNPIVRLLCNELSELLEARCDHQASLQFSKNQYQQELASLMLSTQVDTNLSFCAAVISKNPNVRRLQYLSENPNMNLLAKINFSILAVVAIGLLTIPFTSFSIRAESNMENSNNQKTISLNFQKIPMSALTQILAEFYSANNTIIEPSLKPLIFRNLRVKNVDLKGLSNVTNINWQVKDGNLLVNHRKGNAVVKILSDLEYEKAMNQIGVLLDFDIRHVTMEEGLEHVWTKKMAIWSNFDTPFAVTINETREILFTVSDSDDRVLISSSIYQLNEDGTKERISSPKLLASYGDKATVEQGSDASQHKNILTIGLTPTKVRESDANKQRE